MLAFPRLAQKQILIIESFDSRLTLPPRAQGESPMLMNIYGTTRLSLRKLKAGEYSDRSATVHSFQEKLATNSGLKIVRTKIAG